MSKAIPYDFNVICQVCRESIKGSEATKRWDNLIVGKNHPGCMELKHPLDMPYPLPPEQKPLPFTSPESTDTFITTGCSTMSAIADLAVAECAIADYEDDNSLNLGTFTL